MASAGRSTGTGGTPVPSNAGRCRRLNVGSVVKDRGRGRRSRPRARGRRESSPHRRRRPQSEACEGRGWQDRPILAGREIVPPPRGGLEALDRRQVGKAVERGFPLEARRAEAPFVFAHLTTDL